MSLKAAYRVASFASVHFLLIEDDDEHARLTELALERHRIRNTLDRVCDGVSAIEYLTEAIEGTEESDVQIPDVILLDLHLPALSGHEVLSFIEGEPRLKQAAVVVLTASDSQRERSRAYERSVRSYMLKPIDFDKFVEIVHDLGLYWTLSRQVKDDQHA